MVLVSLCREGEILPPTLPPGLLPAVKSGLTPASVPATAAHGPMPTPVDALSHPPPQPTMSLSSSSHGLIYPHAATPPLVSTPPLVPLATPIVPAPLLVSSDWILPPDMKAKYDTYFEGIDKDRDGIVSGEEVRGLFMASNVPQPVLFHIWSVGYFHIANICSIIFSFCFLNRNLCDITKSGKLNSEQFALAMFLLAEKVRGKDPPKELPPNYIPPSLRHGGAGATTAPTQGGAGATIAPTPSPPVAQSFGSVTSSLVPSNKATPPPTASLLPSSASFGPADYTAIKELDTVTTEIETLRR